jgi:deferrochelatase/peroxidase EfeB
LPPPQQAHACFASLDFTGQGEADLAALMRDWSQAAARMTAGLTAVLTPDSQDSPPADSGEALGLLPARLTVTFGLLLRTLTRSRATLAPTSRPTPAAAEPEIETKFHFCHRRSLRDLKAHEPVRGLARRDID